MITPSSKKYLLLLLLFCLFIPFLYIGFYSNPIADDFTYANTGKTKPLLKALYDEYLYWNGRYSSNILVLNNPISFNRFTLYKLIPSILLFSTLISIYIFIRTLFHKFISRITTLIYALIITLLYLHQMPIISEGIYWYTGAVTYQTSCILSLVYIALHINFTQKNYLLNSKSISTVVLIIIQCILCGLNETIMLLLLAGHGLLFTHQFTQLKHGKKIATSTIVLLLSCILFATIVYIAPGNTIRESYFDSNHQLFKSLLYSSLQVVRFSILWVTSIPFLLSGLLYYRFYNKIKETEISRRITSIFTLKNTLFFFALILFIGTFPSYWSTGIMGQHRTINVSYFFFLLNWFVFLHVLFNRYPISFLNKITTGKKLYILQFLFIISLVTTKNGGELTTDITTKKHIEFNREMENRYTIIETSQDTIYFSSIKNKPATLFVLDITSSPRNWQNESYAIYFGCKEKPVVLLDKN